MDSYIKYYFLKHLGFTFVYEALNWLSGVSGTPSSDFREHRAWLNSTISEVVFRSTVGESSWAILELLRGVARLNYPPVPYLLMLKIQYGIRDLPKVSHMQLMYLYTHPISPVSSINFYIWKFSCVL